MNVRRARLILAALGSLFLVACDIDVKDEGRDKNVDVHTAFGDISVRSGETGPETGLPVYPGAQPMLDEDNEHENADVKLGTSFFAVHVAAASYQSNDAPQAIVDFYKDKMSAYGTVTECKGEIDFEDDSKHPVCTEKFSESEIQLVAGTEDSHRLVVVKPRGEGSEFAVVSVEVGERG
jgi:hypothetical protein